MTVGKLFVLDKNIWYDNYVQTNNHKQISEKRGYNVTLEI